MHVCQSKLKGDNFIKKILFLIISIILSFANYYEKDIQDNKYIPNNIYIDKINLNQNFFSYKESNVDHGIIYLKESDFLNNFYILAAHSGNSRISYFKNIYKLNKGDIIKLTVDNKELIFIVYDKYYANKNGKIVLEKNIKDVLYLTTCDKYNNNRQLIIKSVKKV